MTGLKGSEEDIGKKLRQLSGSKVHFFLYCLPVGPGSKFEDTNPVIMKCMQVAFGKQVWEHCIVVLTQSNLAMGHITAAQQSTDYSQYIGEYTQCFQQELQTLSKLIDMTTFNIFLPTPSPPPIVPAGLKVTDGMTLDSKNWKEVLFEEMSKGHGHVPMTLNYRHEYEYWRRVYNVRWGIIAGVGAGLGANCGLQLGNILGTCLKATKLVHTAARVAVVIGGAGSMAGGLICGGRGGAIGAGIGYIVGHELGICYGRGLKALLKDSKVGLESHLIAYLAAVTGGAVLGAAVGGMLASSEEQIQKIDILFAFLCIFVLFRRY